MAGTYTAPGKPITWSTPPSGYPLTDIGFAQVGMIDIRNPNGQIGAGEGYLRHKLLIYQSQFIIDEGSPVAQARVWLIGYAMGVAHFMSYFRLSGPYDKQVFNFAESLDAIEVRAAGNITPTVTAILNIRYVGLPL